MKFGLFHENRLCYFLHCSLVNVSVILQSFRKSFPINASDNLEKPWYVTTIAIIQFRSSSKFTFIISLQKSSNRLLSLQLRKKLAQAMNSKNSQKKLQKCNSGYYIVFVASKTKVQKLRATLQ